MKRFTTTFPGRGGTVPFSFVPRVQGLTISKRIRGLLLQNSFKSYTGIIKSYTVVTWRHLEEWVLLQLSLPDTFFCPKGINEPEGKIWHLFSRRPYIHTASWLSELVCNCWCVESLPPPHSVSIAVTWFSSLTHEWVTLAHDSVMID